MTSGANWLLERQGSGGEWGEVEMFPDLDQVDRASKCWGPLKANICWVPNKFYHIKLPSVPHQLFQAPVEFQPTAVTAQVVITLASLDYQQKVSC